MTTYFVTRHPGAVEWSRAHGIVVDVCRPHLEMAEIAAGDTVIGILPVHLAAEVCSRGARYFHLAIDLPPDARGQELSAAEMERYGARLEPYDVRLAGFPERNAAAPA